MREKIKKLGWKECAVDYQEFESEAAEYANMTADNELARWAELDKHMMLNEIEGDSLKGLDLDLLGVEILDTLKPIEEIESGILETKEERYIIEVEFPNDMEMKDIRDDLLYKGYMVRIK